MAEWFSDANGDSIGVLVDRSGPDLVLHLLNKSGDVVVTVSASDAADVLEMLRNGIEFLGITGAKSFRFRPGRSVADYLAGEPAC